MAKHSYWTGVRFWATSNSQYDIGMGGWHGFQPALRLPSDTYVRSVWWMNCTFSSDGTATIPGWWLASNVYFVAQFDNLGVIDQADPLDSTEPPDRVAMCGMYPKRYGYDPHFPNGYGIEWEGPPDGIIGGQGRRKGDGTNMPRIAYSVYAVDQNAMFPGVTEPTRIIRCSIYGRILWESDSAS